MLIGGGLAITVDGLLATNDAHEPNGRSLGPFFGIPAALIGIPFALSASYGYSQTARCRAMNRAPLAPAPAP